MTVHGGGPNDAPEPPVVAVGATGVEVERRAGSVAERVHLSTRTRGPQNRVCACGEPLRNQASLCPSCEGSTRRHLASQEAYRADLVVEATRQSRKQPPNEVRGGGSRPLPVDLDAAALLHRQRNILVTWCRTLAEADPHLTRPANRIRSMALYLEAGLKVFRRHEEGPQLVADILRLSRDILRMVDVREKRTQVIGSCPKRWPNPDAGGVEEWCPGEVKATIWADESRPIDTVCSACDASWPSEQYETLRRDLDRREAADRDARLMAREFIKGSVA